jgi:hypothetical protein
VTPLWTVVALLSVIVAVESVAIIALTRQLGLLHLPAGTRPARRRQPWLGPQRGSRLRLDVPPGLIGSQHELILYGFVRPNSGTPAASLSAFASMAAELPGNERALLVSDGDEARARAYLAAHGVSVPLLAGPQLLQVNDIPGTPYAVVADRAGTVITAGPALAEAHLEELLGQARRSQAGHAAAL